MRTRLLALAVLLAALSALSAAEAYGHVHREGAPWINDTLWQWRWRIPWGPWGWHGPWWGWGVFWHLSVDGKVNATIPPSHLVLDTVYGKVLVIVPWIMVDNSTGKPVAGSELLELVGNDVRVSVEGKAMLGYWRSWWWGHDASKGFRLVVKAMVLSVNNTVYVEPSLYYKGGCLSCHRGSWGP
ncbi:MAG: hypothetical protein DSY37_01390 [Hyperthermus sp.]|nr:MAG: hypothetical protein DSY37_01390 [Hyperthermus sp.]